MSGYPGSLPYGLIQTLVQFSLGALLFISLSLFVFEPLQIVRWLIRRANYKRRRTTVIVGKARLVRQFFSVRYYFPVMVPALFVSFSLGVFYFNSACGLQ